MIGGEETGKQIQATGEDIVAEYMLTMHAWELEGERGMIWTKYLLTVHGRWREGWPGPGPGPGPSIYVPTMPRRQRDTLARVHVQYPPKQSNHMGVIS